MDCLENAPPAVSNPTPNLEEGWLASAGQERLLKALFDEYREFLNTLSFVRAMSPDEERTPLLSKLFNPGSFAADHGQEIALGSSGTMNKHKLLLQDPTIHADMPLSFRHWFLEGSQVDPERVITDDEKFYHETLCLRYALQRKNRRLQELEKALAEETSETPEVHSGMAGDGKSRTHPRSSIAKSTGQKPLDSIQRPSTEQNYSDFSMSASYLPVSVDGPLTALEHPAPTAKSTECVLPLRPYSRATGTEATSLWANSTAHGRGSRGRRSWHSLPDNTGSSVLVMTRCSTS